VDHDRRLVGYVLLGLGALLIIVGLILTVWQFMITSQAPMPLFASRDIRVGPAGVSASTNYAGIILIAVGAGLCSFATLLFRAPRSRGP